MFSSVPFAVRVGFVIGAEILETTFEREGATETGEPGGTLSYGTERSSPGLETEPCRGRAFFLPKRLSIIKGKEVVAASSVLWGI